MRNCDCSSPNGGTPLKAPKKSASIVARGAHFPSTGSVEGEVDAGVPDVAVEDPLVDAGLPRTSRYRNWASGNLGVLALPEGAEQPTVVEHRRADEAADSERLPLAELDHLLS